jgi:hypothetical protein
MLQDLASAMQANRPSYFMGTIVMTKYSDEVWEIADGQQRLATTMIILCVTRDLFLSAGDEKRARSIEQDFIFWIDPDSAEEVARLTLNLDDNDFFYWRIVRRPSDRSRDMEPTLASHHLLHGAYASVQRYFNELRGQVGEGFFDALLRWRRYLLNSAKVLVLKVSDPKLAFVMFVTLNDRGVRTSQADLVKNYLFEQAEAGKRAGEAHRAWSSMRALVESIGDGDELLMEFVRWSCCVLYGITREKEVFDRIVEHAQGPTNAIKVLRSLERLANDCAALFNPDHSKWDDYPNEVRSLVRELVGLEVKQMRPLLLAIAKNFTPARAAVCFKRMIAWAVRMTIAGGTKAGRLDVFYANLAYGVNGGRIKDYAGLLAATKGGIPSDAEFQSYFEGMRVRVSKPARYYLRSLEKTVHAEKEPGWNPNENPDEITLEDIMPQSVGPEWAASAQDVETHCNRLGNLALLQASQNIGAGRSGFEAKKMIFAAAPYALTQMVARFKRWGVKEIEKRQKELAKHAVATWPVDA